MKWLVRLFVRCSSPSIALGIFGIATKMECHTFYSRSLLLDQYQIHLNTQSYFNGDIFRWKDLVLFRWFDGFSDFILQQLYSYQNMLGHQSSNLWFYAFFVIVKFNNIFWPSLEYLIFVHHYVSFFWFQKPVAQRVRFPFKSLILASMAVVFCLCYCSLCLHCSSSHFYWLVINKLRSNTNTRIIVFKYIVVIKLVCYFTVK